MDIKLKAKLDKALVAGQTWQCPPIMVHDSTGYHYNLVDCIGPKCQNVLEFQLKDSTEFTFPPEFSDASDETRDRLAFFSAHGGSRGRLHSSPCFNPF